MTLTIGVIYLQSKYALKEIDFGLGRDKLFTTVLIGGIGGLFVSVANIKYYFSNAIIHTGNFKFDEYVAVESGYIQVVLFIIFTAIIIPILEEIIFRGFIYRILKNKYDWFWASIVTTIAFGLFHANIVTAIIQSIIFIIILEKSKSLGACILAHIMTNAIYCLNIYTNYGG
jgi:membrane protease YdiL (CAAX protease family)